VAGSVVVNLRLPPELAEATRVRAAQEERTASAVIRRALKRDLEREPDAPEQPEAA
jgi:plasmid stability protein